jgi:pimeloyl-ACP methyl ester carboxylesterase
VEIFQCIAQKSNYGCNAKRDAMLVGHSLGGTILINVLAEWAPQCALRRIFIIAAPFVGEGGWTSPEIELPSDFSARLPPGIPIFLYHGSEDETAPLKHLELYAQAIPSAHVRRLNGRDHQLNNDLSVVANDIRQLG